MLVPDIAACIAQGGQWREGACVLGRRRLRDKEAGRANARSLAASLLTLNLPRLKSLTCAQRLEISLVLASGSSPCLSSTQHSGNCQHTYDALRNARRDVRNAGAASSSGNVLTHTVVQESRDQHNGRTLSVVGYFNTNACLRNDVGTAAKHVSLGRTEVLSKVVVSAVSCVGGPVQCGGIAPLRDVNLIRVTVTSDLSHFENYRSKPVFVSVFAGLLAAMLLLVGVAITLDYCTYRHKRDAIRQLLFESYGQVYGYLDW